jgi:hypothetical protein
VVQGRRGAARNVRRQVRLRQGHHRQRHAPHQGREQGRLRHVQVPHREHETGHQVRPQRRRCVGRCCKC